MWRGSGWTEEEQNKCFELFFQTCEGERNLSDPLVFNSIWPDLAADLSTATNEDFSVADVTSQISRLRLQYKYFEEYITWPHVHLVPGTTRVTVSPRYYNRKDDISLNFRVDGFPWYYECRSVFLTGRAAQIDVEDDPYPENQQPKHPNPIPQAPENPHPGNNEPYRVGGRKKDPIFLEDYDDLEYEELDYLQKSSDGYGTDNRDPFMDGWDGGLHRGSCSPPFPSDEPSP